MHRSATTLAVIGVLACSIVSARADYEDAVAAYERGDYATALNEFGPLAAKGHAKAQFNLGFMYDNGEGIPANYVEAARWYRKSAAQGNVLGQYSLGGMYYRGEGVSQNYKEAMKWFRKAAEQGDAYAQVNLGFMYGAGKGVPVNYVKAYVWYSLAQGQGNPEGAKGLYLIKNEMTAAELAEAQFLATELMEKHSNLGEME